VQSHRQRTIYEVHPELSFFQINGDKPLQYSKRTAKGVDERRELLRKRFPAADRSISAGTVPQRLNPHVLDATAALWTARRVVAKAVTRVPEQPEWNGEGMRMEIVR
jgi:predicted RNase H-like nuclease